MGQVTDDVALRSAESPQCLAGDLSWLLSQASYALATELTAGLAALGISPRAHHVLATATTGHFTQTELAQTVGLDKTTMVVTLDELETAGLAERRASDGDRRVRVVSVTRAGKRKVAEAQRVIDWIQADVLETLPARDRSALIGALCDLVGDRLSRPAQCAQSVRRRAPRS